MDRTGEKKLQCANHPPLLFSVWVLLFIDGIRIWIYFGVLRSRYGWIRMGSGVQS